MQPKKEKTKTKTKNKEKEKKKKANLFLLPAFCFYIFQYCDHFGEPEDSN